MHAKHLVQLAIQLTSAGNALTHSHVQAAGDAAHAYWLANRFRCDAWHERISAHRTAIEKVGTSRRARLWAEMVPTLEEILISEPLTRIVAYIASHLERRRADADWGPLSHSVLDSHIEARHRCLNLMVFGYGFPVERAVRLNRLRRLLEAFNDRLIGCLPALSGLDRYAFEVRAVANAQLESRLQALTSRSVDVHLQSLSASLGSTVKTEYEQRSPNSQFNQRIAEAALAMLPEDVFDSFGVLRGPLQNVLSHTSTDVSIGTDDLEKPLAAPFDLLAVTKRDARSGQSSSRRFDTN